MKRLYIPFAWEMLFIVATILLPKQAFYLFFVFYLGLLIYCYYFYKQFSFRKLGKNMTRVTRFWIPVVITFVGLLLANYIKTNIIQQNYPLLKDGFVVIYTRNNFLSTVVYAIMMMIMKPVAEELFFRKAIIKFGSKKRVFVLTIISLLLCAITRAHGVVGIAEWMLMALPVTIAYLVTRNIYISVMAHVAFEFYDNMYPVVYAIARILYPSS